MISQLKIIQLSQQLQTTELNIRREYIQHLFLSYFYKQNGSDLFLFKGGTALRIVFNSPRFSEDLDFSSKKTGLKAIEDIILATLNNIEREGIKTNIVESKSTSGGYLANLEFELSQHKITILIQISFRNSKLVNEVVLINNEFIIPYTIILLDRHRLVEEKIQALLSRAKPRDFYDLYFIIRGNLINLQQKELFRPIIHKLDSVNLNFETELKQFLPKSYWPVIRDFKTSLKREISRFI